MPWPGLQAATALLPLPPGVPTARGAASCQLCLHACMDAWRLLTAGVSLHCSLSVWAYEKLAPKKWGVIGIEHRPVACGYKPRNIAKVSA